MDQVNKVQAASAESSDMLARAVDKARAGAHDKVNQVSAAVPPVVDRIAAGAHRSVDGIASVASRAADAIGTSGARVEDARARVAGQVQGYVRENPWTSLGLAVAAGFLVSRLVGSRSDR